MFIYNEGKRVEFYITFFHK